jgi:hypothetical protein
LATLAGQVNLSQQIPSFHRTADLPSDVISGDQRQPIGKLKRLKIVFHEGLSCVMKKVTNFNCISSEEAM